LQKLKLCVRYRKNENEKYAEIMKGQEHILSQRITHSPHLQHWTPFNSWKVTSAFNQSYSTLTKQCSIYDNNVIFLIFMLLFFEIFMCWPKLNQKPYYSLKCKLWEFEDFSLLCIFIVLSLIKKRREWIVNILWVLSNVKFTCDFDINYRFFFFFW
jgi:hypothetical protein